MYVSRASLHNLSFIKNLELVPGCRILISKRNMIIPHIEDNLDRGFYYDTYPVQCPCCGGPTRIRKGRTNKGKVLETLHCDNPECDSQILKKYVHFAAKKAMDISGLSESNLRRFLECGWLTSFQDIYHLDRYRKEMIALEGYGEKSYEKLWTTVNESRNTDFIHYLTAMDIPMVGKTKSRVLCETRVPFPWRITGRYVETFASCAEIQFQGAGNNGFWSHILATLGRYLIGTMTGTVIAFVCLFLIAWFKSFNGRSVDGFCSGGRLYSRAFSGVRWGRVV